MSEALKIPRKRILEASREAVRPSACEDYRDYLAALYDWCKAHCEGYSYIRFAFDLGFGESNMIHRAILKKRHLRAASVEKIIEAVKLESTERTFLRTLHAYNIAGASEVRSALHTRLLETRARRTAKQLAPEQLEYFQQWYHPVIREMLALPACDGSPAWIAAHLEPKVSAPAIAKSIELLKRLNLVAWDEEKGKFACVDTVVTTSDDIESLALVKYHGSVLDLAKLSIANVSEDKRDISALTMSVSRETAERLREEVRAFRKRVIEIAGADAEPQEVVQLNIQLFPFTR